MKLYLSVVTVFGILIALVGIFWGRLFIKKCEHFWRPCAMDGVPCKWCDYCNEFHRITPAEFYAQFGQDFQTWISRPVFNRR